MGTRRGQVIAGLLAVVAGLALVVAGGPATGQASGQTSGQTSSSTTDAYLPKDGKAAHPALIMVHGGGWEGGDMLEFAPFAAMAATDQHWAAFAVNYRLDVNDRSAWPDELHDVQAAIRYIVANASTYGIDTDNVLLMGDSAGARSGPTSRPMCRSWRWRSGRPRSTSPTWSATPARPPASAAPTRRATSSGPPPTSSTTSAAGRPHVRRPTPTRRRSPGCRPRRCRPTSPTRPTS